MKALRAFARWLEDRTGLAKVIRPLLEHRVPGDTGWMYVFGSATLMAFLLQIVTGAALTTVYVPSAGQAYASLEFITNQASLGRFLRGMHYFGASAMILLVGVHAIRVFLTGSYKFPREMNWLSGILLLALTVAMGFTGQVLRWDQDGVWSTVVAAEQAGRVPFIGRMLARLLLAGDNVGTSTLSHFFAYHVFLIPGLILMVVGLHVYLVVRNGISEPPRAGQPVERQGYRASYQSLLDRRGVPFWPHAAWRDVTAGLLVIIAVLVCAYAFGPKALGRPPDPSTIQALPRPDWYLLWYFALLALLPHREEPYLLWVIPFAAGLALILLPLVFGVGERHLRRRPWAWLSTATIVVSVGVLWRLGAESPWSPDFSAPPLGASVVASTDTLIVRGADLFHERGCEYCHRISGFGGRRGPDLTTIGAELSRIEMTERIEEGGVNMPAFAGILTSAEVQALVAFLESRTTPASRTGTADAQ